MHLGHKGSFSSRRGLAPLWETLDIALTYHCTAVSEVMAGVLSNLSNQLPTTTHSARIVNLQDKSL